MAQQVVDVFAVQSAIVVDKGQGTPLGCCECQIERTGFACAR
jgi:hypothetical protein